MTLPDQISPEVLNQIVEKYKTDLEALPKLPGLPIGIPIHHIRGGQIINQAAGRIELRPDRSLTVDNKSPNPIVEVVYLLPDIENLGTFSVRTSPARLIKINNDWQNANLTGPGKRTHTVPVNDITNRVTLRFEVLSKTFAIDVLKDPVDASVELYTYTIPPCATAISGTGTIRYFSGAEIKIEDSAPVLLLRIDENFNFSIREGGIYARFIGEAPAKVRIGNAWIPTLRTSL